MTPSDQVTLYIIAVTLMVVGMALLSLLVTKAARRTGWTVFATGCFLLIAAVVEIMARTYLDP